MPAARPPVPQQLRPSVSTTPEPRLAANASPGPMVETKPEAAQSPAPQTPAVQPTINPAEAMQAIVNDPAVKKAMEVFNARIIHVEPRRK